MNDLYRRLLRCAAVICAVAATMAFRGQAQSQESARLTGNHPVSLQVAGTAEMAAVTTLHMEAVLNLRNRDQLALLEANLQNRDSPGYHKWLSASQFSQRFGPSPAQLQAVAAWLTASGFTVTGSSLFNRTVSFTGSYAVVKQALQATILSDGTRFANTADPVIPANLAGTIEAISGLSGALDQTGQASDAVISGQSGTYFGPGDFYTFYDETPVLNGGNTGTSGPDCIALPEIATINQSVLGMFTSQFGLPAIQLTVIKVNGANPGLPTDNEPYLDIEWAHAVSPSTPIYMYVANNYQDALRQAVGDNLCGVISSSVEDGNPSVPEIKSLDDVAAQAVAQGQTIFHSSGDYGAAWKSGSPVPNGMPTVCGLYQPSVDEEAASPYLTSVGGTQFAPVYDASGNDTSTLDDNLEDAWNTANIFMLPKPPPPGCPLKDATGGGMSAIFPKPAWQSGPGVPNDGVRDVPDIALGANGSTKDVGAEGYPAFWVASQKVTDPAPVWGGTGGTSIASPMWAGVSRLIAQAQGVSRLGNINQRLYELGSLANPQLGLHDVTQGDNDDNGVTGYTAGPGFDLVTGWGSPDVAKLVASFPGAATTFKAASTSANASVAGTNETVDGGQFTITNATASALHVDQITVAFSKPALFSTATLIAAVGTTTPATVLARPAASTVFYFGQPFSIPPGKSANLALQMTIADNPSPVGMIGLTSPGSGDNGPFRSLPGAGAIVLAAALLATVMIRRRGNPGSAALLAGCLLIALAAGCSGSSSSSPAPTAAPTATPAPSPTPFPPQTSRQTVPKGGIGLDDGQGGKVAVTGLPGDLGTVTVNY